MWPARRLKGAISSPLDMTNRRPWTPPDTDSEYSVSYTPDDAGEEGGDGDRARNSEHAPSPLSQLRRSSQARTLDRRSKPTTISTETHFSTNHPFDMDAQRIARSCSVESSPLANSDHESARRSTSTFASLADSGYVGGADEPHTPVKQTRIPDALPLSIPHYPYTPDSARMPTHKFTIPQLSPSPSPSPSPLPSKIVPPLDPSPSMSWDSKVPSPIQNALSSCITQLENLIKTRQPNEEQMEYIVARFEEMAQFLSAPEAQSRQSDDHLFSELTEIPSGLGIISGVLTDNSHRIEHDEVATALHYIKEVGRYIADVSRHTEHLKKRFDETKQLNHMQKEIIADLKRILKVQQVEMEKMTEELDIELRAVDEQTQRDEPPEQQVEKRQKIEPSKPCPPVSFWTAIGEALDAVGELWLEY